MSKKRNIKYSKKINYKHELEKKLIANNIAKDHDISIEDATKIVNSIYEDVCSAFGTHRFK